MVLSDVDDYELMVDDLLESLTLAIHKYKSAWWWQSDKKTVATMQIIDTLRRMRNGIGDPINCNMQSRPEDFLRYELQQLLKINIKKGDLFLESIGNKMGKVIINSKEIDISGDNVVITTRGSTISINSNVIGSNYTGEVSIKVEGAVAQIDAGGNVACGDVGGSVDAGGNVACSNVNGNIDAGGNVNASKVSGSIDAGGNVSIR